MIIVCITITKSPNNFQYLIDETWIRGLIIFFYLIIFVLGVVGNVLVILVVVKERSMQASEQSKGASTYYIRIIVGYLDSFLHSYSHPTSLPFVCLWGTHSPSPSADVMYGWSPEARESIAINMLERRTTTRRQFCFRVAVIIKALSMYQCWGDS